MFERKRLVREREERSEKMIEQKCEQVLNQLLFRVEAAALAAEKIGAFLAAFVERRCPDTNRVLSAM